MEISRDKKNPTWVWVNKEHTIKRIVLDIENGCICVSSGDNDLYMNNYRYGINFWDYCSIISEPKLRPFKDQFEFIDWLEKTGRIDMRIQNKESKKMITILDSNEQIYDKLFKYWVWFNDKTFIGIEE